MAIHAKQTGAPVNRLLPGWPALALLGLCAVLVSGCVVPDGGGYGYAGPVGWPGYYEPYGTAYGGWGPDFLIGPVGGGGWRGGGRGGWHGGGRGFGGGGQRGFRGVSGGRAMPSIPGGRGGFGGRARGGGHGGGGRH